MTFEKKLEKAMQELNLTQVQVCSLTGKSKGSVSQYLSGKQVPSEKVQRDIAVSLGLEEDYFEKLSDEVKILPSYEVRNGVIPRFKPEEVAHFMGMSPSTIKSGLRQRVFPWGYAIQTSDHRWRYFINAKRFMEIEGLTEC